jgi:hypothetical protein
MGEAALILCLLLKIQPERNPAAAPILFHPATPVPWLTISLPLLGEHKSD